MRYLFCFLYLNMNCKWHYAAELYNNYEAQAYNKSDERKFETEL